MRRWKKTRDRQPLRQLITGFERSLAKEKLEVTAAKVAFLQSQSELRVRGKQKGTEDERNLVELGQAIKDLKEEISRPRHNFGFLENLDASACWLALFWSFTTLYNQLMKDGLPWLYVCFHIGTFYLTIRAVFRIYLMFRHKAGWEEISRFNHFLLFLTGVSSLRLIQPLLRGDECHKCLFEAVENCDRTNGCLVEIGGIFVGRLHA